jgi:hypothetical protein
LNDINEKALDALGKAYTELLARQLISERAIQCLIRRMLHGAPDDVKEKELYSYFQAIRSAAAAHIGSSSFTNDEAIAAIDKAIAVFEHDTRTAQQLPQNS